MAKNFKNKVFTETDWIIRTVGVPPETKCFRCGKTAKQAYKGEWVATGINHPEYFQTKSFYRLHDGKRHECANCHKENELKSLFDLMDKRDAQRKLINNK